MYKFGYYVTTEGWGGEGIYDTTKSVGKESDGRDIIPEDAIMIGTGNGYEGFVINKEWCERAVTQMNKER